MFSGRHPEKLLAELPPNTTLSQEQQAFIDWATRKARWYRKWGLLGWTAHIWLNAISLVIAVAVPFGLATILYLPKDATDPLNRYFLIASGIGAACQVLTHAMRFRERAFRGRRLAAELQAGIVEFKTGLRPYDELVRIATRLLREEIEEEGP